MLLRLNNWQISNAYSLLKECFDKSLPVEAGMAPDRLHRIFLDTLNGLYDMWLAFSEKEELYMIGLTRISADDITGLRSMLIYALVIVGNASEETRNADIEKLVEYAKELDCKYISAYTHEESVARRFLQNFSTERAYEYYVKVPVNK